MTSEGLGEMFEGDTCADKFPLVLMGGRAEGLKFEERGPPSALAEISYYKHSDSVFEENSVTVYASDI